MKVKKILSLLSIIAMVATSVTAFAAPAGYEQSYVFGPTYNASAVLAQKINANAVLPDVDNVIMDIDVKKITDAEAEALDCKPASKYAGKAYLVTFDIKNLGTLYSEYNSDWDCFGGGFGLTDVKFNLVANDTSYSIKNVANDINFQFKKNSSDAKISNFIVSNDPATEATFAFPKYSEGESTKAENASVMFQSVICADENFTFDVDNCNVMLTNYIFDEDVENVVPKTTDGIGYNAVQVAIWHPASITLGTAPIGPTATESVAANGANTKTYTFENSTAMAGKKVVMQNATMSTSGMTKDTRFIVSDGTRTQIFGSDIWAKLGTEGDGVIDVANVSFGIIVDAANTSTFTFTVE